MKIEFGAVVTLDAKEDASKVRAEHFAACKSEVTAVIKDVRARQKEGLEKAQGKETKK